MLIFSCDSKEISYPWAVGIWYILWDRWFRNKDPQVFAKASGWVVIPWQPLYKKFSIFEFSILSGNIALENHANGTARLLFKQHVYPWISLFILSFSISSLIFSTSVWNMFEGFIVKAIFWIILFIEIGFTMIESTSFSAMNETYSSETSGVMQIIFSLFRKTSFKDLKSKHWIFH